MVVNQSIPSDIKAIIAQSKNKAIRAIDHQPALMYRHTGNVFLKKNRKEKNRAD